MSPDTWMQVLSGITLFSIVVALFYRHRCGEYHAALLEILEDLEEVDEAMVDTREMLEAMQSSPCLISLPTPSSN